jgi:hypothetical protein
MSETEERFRGTLNDPQFVKFRFKKYLPDTARFIRSDADIRMAVARWCEMSESNSTTNLEREYGNISDWDVSQVTDIMIYLYQISNIKYQQQNNLDVNHLFM